MAQVHLTLEDDILKDLKNNCPIDILNQKDRLQFCIAYLQHKSARHSGHFE